MDIDPAPPALPQAPSRTFHPSPPADSPAQLALLLSSALQDADALRTQLANEQKRVHNLENALNRLSNLSDVENASSPTGSGAGAAKMRREKLADAEARAEHAERYVLLCFSSYLLSANLPFF